LTPGRHPRLAILLAIPAAALVAPVGQGLDFTHPGGSEGGGALSREAGEGWGGGGAALPRVEARERAPSSAPAASSNLSWLRPCWLPDVKRQALCGTYRVWENREAKAGRRIGLFVAVLSARSRTPQPDPVFYLDGGPGNAASTSAAYLVRLLDDVLEDRDLVLVDQRGTGGSNALTCDLGPSGSARAATGLFRLAELRNCRRKLEQKADLTRYTTPVAMADLDEIRQALGYARINLVGASYGAAAAQVYLRAYPDRARSAVLLAAGPLDIRYPLYVARDHQRALDLLFDDCAADAPCAAAFPKLRDDFARMMARLAAGPVRAEVPGLDPAHPRRKETVLLTLDLVRLTLPHRLYSAEAAARVPNSIHRAAQGDFTELARACRIIQRLTWDDPSQGLFLSVSCSEDEAVLDPALVERETRGTFVGDIRVRLQSARCAEWPRAPLPPGYREPVQSAVPALLLTGQADPILPPVWAEEVARRLPNSRLVVVPHAGHWPVTPCTQGLVRQFLRAGSAQGLDSSCVAGNRRPPFVVP
jgi:pimeloyl-ACP methyl ester carboxylesterase